MLVLHLSWALGLEENHVPMFLLKSLRAPKDEHEDPTSHGFCNLSWLGPTSQNVGSLCLCGLWDPNSVATRPERGCGDRSFQATRVELLKCGKKDKEERESVSLPAECMLAVASPRRMKKHHHPLFLHVLCQPSYLCAEIKLSSGFQLIKGSCSYGVLVDHPHARSMPSSQFLLGALRSCSIISRVGQLCMLEGVEVHKYPREPIMPGRCIETQAQVSGGTSLGLGVLLLETEGLGSGFSLEHRFCVARMG